MFGVCLVYTRNYNQFCTMYIVHIILLVNGIVYFCHVGQNFFGGIWEGHLEFALKRAPYHLTMLNKYQYGLFIIC